jgi:hypothetical protein
MEAPKMPRMHQPVHPTISEVRSDEVDGDADRKREAGDGFREWPDLKRTVIQEQDDRDDDEDVEQRGTEVLRGHLRVRDGSRAPDHFPDRPNQGRRGRSSEEQNGTVDDRERWGFQRQLHRVTEESEC